MLCGREERGAAAQRFASGNRLDPRSDSTVREEAEDRVCRATSTENEAMLCCMWARKLRRTSSSVQVQDQLILIQGLLSWVGVRFAEAETRLSGSGLGPSRNEEDERRTRLFPADGDRE